MSDKIKFFYYNLVNQPATVITPSSQNVQFPAENLKHDFRTKVFRATTASASVVFDFITTEPVDSILIASHTLNGFGFNGALTIEANATNTWGSPAFSTTLTPNHEFGFGATILESPESYRYWRVSGVGSTYFELGKIFIGSQYIPQRNIGIGFTFDSEDQSSYSETRYGQRFIDELPSRNNIRGQINLINKENVDPFFDFINYVGRKRPFWCILNNSGEVINDPFRFAGMFYFRERPQSKHVINGIYSFTLTMDGAM